MGDKETETTATVYISPQEEVKEGVGHKAQEMDFGALGGWEEEASDPSVSRLSFLLKITDREWRYSTSSKAASW